MGYMVFTVVFSDGSRQAYLTGGLVDFIDYPPLRGPKDVIDVLPHVGRDANPLHGPKCYWCIYEGKNLEWKDVYKRQTYGLAPFVILGPGEEEVGAVVRRQMGASATVFDSLSLRELIALIAGARLFVGNDAGPMHLAAALQRPVVAIFGSSSSVHWRPWETPSRVAQNDFPCNPCPGDKCYAFDEPRCILSVSVEQVREACEALLCNN